MQYSIRTDKEPAANRHAVWLHWWESDQIPFNAAPTTLPFCWTISTCNKQKVRRQLQHQEGTNLGGEGGRCWWGDKSIFVILGVYPALWVKHRGEKKEKIPAWEQPLFMKCMKASTLQPHRSLPLDLPQHSWWGEGTWTRQPGTATPCQITNPCEGTQEDAALRTGARQHSGSTTSYNKKKPPKKKKKVRKKIRQTNK